MKAKVSETGLEATPVYPYTDKWTISYNDFEAANKTYPLTEKQKSRSIIECELVWQGKDETETKWFILNPKDIQLAKAMIGYETRQALQPEKVKEEIVESPNELPKDEAIKEAAEIIINKYDSNAICPVPTEMHGNPPIII